VAIGAAEHKVIGVWDLSDGSMQVLGPAEDAGEGYWGAYWSLAFLRDGSLLSVTRENLIRRWSLEDGSSEVVVDGRCGLFGVQPESNAAVIGSMNPDGSGTLLTVDFETGERRTFPDLAPRASEPAGLALSPRGDVIAIGFADGAVQVRKLSGDDPAYLYGHDAMVLGLAFSPDGSLLASAGQDGSIRVWPVPDLSKPPLQALPHDELLARLDSFTNLRVSRDDPSTTGWKLEIGPFPGWETAPEW
jgi:WD40 repeat protein